MQPSISTTRRQRAVGHLQALYTVVTALALTTAITSLIDQTAQIPVKVTVFPYFVAYFVTLVPFYHGALCHLDKAYLGVLQTTPKAGALLVDWVLLFVESCVLLGLALLIQTPQSFFHGLLALLLFDAAWAFGAHLAFSPERRGLTVEAKWAIINFVTSVLLIGILVFLDSLDPAQKPVESYRWLIIVSLTVARTVADYAWCWSGYFPPDSEVAPG